MTQTSVEAVEKVRSDQILDVYEGKTKRIVQKPGHGIRENKQSRMVSA